jgi:hypothetical protein
MKDKKFTGTLYRRIDDVIVILDGKDFKFQEHFNGFAYDIKNSMFAKIFGVKRFLAIFEALFQFQGTMRTFEVTDNHILVDGLSHHCDGSIHFTGYQEEIWTKKGK